jgi:hypothetical protein
MTDHVYVPASGLGTRMLSESVGLPKLLMQHEGLTHLQHLRLLHPNAFFAVAMRSNFSEMLNSLPWMRVFIDDERPGYITVLSRMLMIDEFGPQRHVFCHLDDSIPVRGYEEMTKAIEFYLTENEIVCGVRTRRSRTAARLSDGLFRFDNGPVDSEQIGCSGFVAFQSEEIFLHCVTGAMSDGHGQSMPMLVNVGKRRGYGVHFLYLQNWVSRGDLTQLEV